MLLNSEISFGLNTIVGSVAMAGFGLLWFLIKSDREATKKSIEDISEKVDDHGKLIEANRKEIDKRVTELHFTLLDEFTKLREKINEFRK